MADRKDEKDKIEQKVRDVVEILSSLNSAIKKAGGCELSLDILRTWSAEQLLFHLAPNKIYFIHNPNSRSTETPPGGPEVTVWVAEYYNVSFSIDPQHVKTKVYKTLTDAANEAQLFIHTKHYLKFITDGWSTLMGYRNSAPYEIHFREYELLPKHT